MRIRGGMPLAQHARKCKLNKTRDIIFQVKYSHHKFSRITDPFAFGIPYVPLLPGSYLGFGSAELNAAHCKTFKLYSKVITSKSSRTLPRGNVSALN